MPDWSYQTVFRPLLFRLPAKAARDLTLGVMGRLARLPLGLALIDFLGHMRPPAALQRTCLGVCFPTPVGLGTGIDTEAAALSALARFGFGFLEVGPVTVEPTAAEPSQRQPDQEALWFPYLPANPGMAALSQRLAKTPLPVPLIVRLGNLPGTLPPEATEECRRMIGALSPHVAMFSIMAPGPASGAIWDGDRWAGHVDAVVQAAQASSPPRPVLVVITPDLLPELVDFMMEPALAKGVGGILIDGAIRTERPGWSKGAPARQLAVDMVRHVRQRWGPEVPVIAGGGVHEPAHALELLGAGANCVQIDSGLVFSGPGLPKRINEALLFAELHRTEHKAQRQAVEQDLQRPSAAAAMQTRTEPAARSWFWTMLMGAGMLGGGILALIIAATRVVLPYDEIFSGMTRAELAAINDRLLPFMTHDRVSLAGTMIAIGVLYVYVSVCGIRRGMHWARMAVLTSAFAGFASFFFFLGFGYFDPFHAFVTAVLFQFLLLALHAPLGASVPDVLPNLHNEWRWRWSQWGQLLFVAEGAGLIGGGLMISLIGVTTVFVHEDLEFMRTTAEALTAANPRLVPLVAHDRASFGGMLVASGITVLLTALWGFGQGRRWLWWCLLLAGAAGYGPGIAVHLAVGYMDLWHLTPAVGGCAMLIVALVLCYPYLCQRDANLEAAWRRYLASQLAVRTR